MAVPRKNSASQISALKEAAHDLFVTRPLLYIAGLRGKMTDLPMTNFEIGCDFAERGAMRDAAMRFRITVKLDPHFTQAWHNLGVCLMQLGDRGKAIEAFQRTLALQPTHEEARYMLATISPESVARDAWPTRMPMSLVKRFFTAAAPFYVEYERQNSYEGPAVCAQKLAPHLTAQTGLNVLDLGCGVGLAATVWRGKAASVTGVDIVPEMVAEARTMKSSTTILFDTVIQGDLHAPETISIPEQSVDVALVCNVTQFLGDLTGLMKGLSQWLKTGGLVAITVEPGVAQAAYGVNPATARFGYSAAYLQDMAKTHGFQVLVQERVHLYPDIPAGIVVMKKGS